MVLCQVIVDIAERHLYPINVFGRKKVRICKVDYQYSADNGEIIYLESDILRLPLGNFPYFTFVPVGTYQVGNIHSDMELICDFNGNLDITVRDWVTRDIASDFELLVLTLDITDP